MPATAAPLARDRPEYPDLARVLSVARRRWYWIVAAALACVAVAALAGRTAPTYTANVTLLVGSIDGEFQDLRAGGQQAQTYAQLATTRPVLAATARRLQGAMSADELAGGVTAKADDTTRLLTLSVSSASGRRAAAAAAALAAELRAQTSGPGGLHAMRVVDPAEVPAHAGGGGSEKLIAIAGLAGALAALALLVVADAARRRIIGEEDLAAVAAAPALGVIAAGRSGRSRADALLATRLVAGRVLALCPPSAPRIVLTAAAPGGRGTGDVALLLSGARGGERRIVVADAAGDLTAALGLGGRPGLRDGLLAPARALPAMLGAALVEHRRGLKVLPLGDVPAPQSFDAQAASRLLARLQRSADLVILAAGDLQQPAGPLDWAALAGAAVVVARRGRTTTDELARAVDGIAVGGIPVGTVLAPPPRRRRRGARRGGATRLLPGRRREATPAAVTSPSS
ncbi:MAG TPA: Wzz/FepE/Etk N-terminal domain-containing protein [Solirubrobacteraceae bacterium]|nr:Wzz/FepE/Etk N-terminal domain-containing protein [Solirubrobacteraceae bacterium]